MKFLPVFVSLLFFVVGVFGGYSLRYHPRVIEKVVEKKVYDFLQELDVIELYANYIGSNVVLETVLDKQKLICWRDGYKAGFEAGVVCE